MHMADALISPAVGMAGWGVALAAAAYAATRLQKAATLEKTVPMMGVLAAFVFAAQMINFTIPGTGSSGHIGGALLLCILLGPHAALLAMASVLTVQALLFADGGLLALGCNIVNLGVLVCYVVYPLIFRPLVGNGSHVMRRIAAFGIAPIANAGLGALGVVLQTTASGVSELPFGTFVLLMIPIHLAIGVGEGLITAAVVGFVGKAHPELVDFAPRRIEPVSVGFARYKGVISVLAVVTMLTGGVLSWFASANPDGLEWAIEKVAGHPEIQGASEGGVHKTLSGLQANVALMPDYDFKQAEDVEAKEAQNVAAAQPVAKPGTSLAGVFGAFITLAIAAVIGIGLRRRSHVVKNSKT